ncbi:sensor histidine kinase [Natrinema salaciae]|uniref:histidine kinase n=1 Tax=Natrinema salaciae TaxID=1186196 RepID=A0A1H9BPR9_9EURY|nr:histidine kinase N-terminal 7TM domain-containing protein [Natrinema salaciae]SEP90533.1 Histidine kinase-, DNA gyrase B-, and HSP90-like ATPase [Natrinema salaciae]
MGLPIDPYSVVLLLSFVVAVGTVAAAWRTRPAPGSASLSALMATVAVWLGAHVLEIESTALAWKLHWANLQWLCAAAIPTLFLVFALQYTGKDRWLTRRKQGLLAIEPLVMAGLLAINDWTHVLWGPAGTETVALAGWWESTATVATSEPNVGLFVHLGYATLCLAATSVLVLDLIVRSERLYRWQGVVVFVAITVPWATAVVSTSSLETIGVTPIGFTVTGLAITFGLYRYRLLEIAPIARSEVVTNLESGVLVVDADRRIVDSNPVAQEIFGRSRDDLVGEPIADVVPAVDIDPSIDGTLETDGSDSATGRGNDDRTAEGATTGADAANDAENRPVQFSLGDESDRRYYTHSTSPIDDGRGRPIGWTIVVHDVTERVRRERELERTNRKLDEFAAVVSHDLRNPLTVSKGYLDLLEEEYDPEYVRTVAESHDRMEALIDDVLALARQGQAAVEHEPIALEAVARAAWSTVDTDGATLSIVDGGTVEADRTRLRQLLENLFRNAVEHGSAGGQDGYRPDDVLEHGPAKSRLGRETATERDEAALTVTVGTLENGFFVADSGSGFEDGPAAVFESGYTTSENGTGLGLSIVADVCDEHGWEVTATESTDGGARFEIVGVDVRDPAADGGSAGSPSAVGEIG